MPLRVMVREESRAHVLELSGRLDLETSPILQQNLADLLAGGTHRFVLNLSGLTFVDSAGMAAFFVIRSQVGARGGRLALAEPCGVVHGILARMGLLRVFAVFPREREALDWITGPPAGGGP